MSDRPEDWGTRKGCDHCHRQYHHTYYDVSSIRYAKERHMPDITTNFNALTRDQLIVLARETTHYKGKDWWTDQDAPFDIWLRTL